MRQIVAWTIVTALIAASAPQAVATQSHRQMRTEWAASEHTRNVRNAIAQPLQSGWQYSRRSAAAGR